MPQKIPKKCFECAFLAIEQVREVHSKCYVESSCKCRRSRIRNQGQIRERRNRSTGIALEKIDVDAPVIHHAQLLVWRLNYVDSPIHAIGASIWLGDTQIGLVQPVHCAGWKPRQAIDYVEQVLIAIGEQYPVVKAFSDEVLMPPRSCEITGCLLNHS